MGLFDPIPPLYKGGEGDFKTPLHPPYKRGTKGLKKDWL